MKNKKDIKCKTWIFYLWRKNINMRKILIVYLWKLKINILYFSIYIFYQNSLQSTFVSYVHIVHMYRTYVYMYISCICICVYIILLNILILVVLIFIFFSTNKISSSIVHMSIFSMHITNTDVSFVEYHIWQTDWLIIKILNERKSAIIGTQYIFLTRIIF